MEKRICLYIYANYFFPPQASIYTWRWDFACTCISLFPCRPLTYNFSKLLLYFSKLQNYRMCSFHDNHQQKGLRKFCFHNVLNRSAYWGLISFIAYERRLTKILQIVFKRGHKGRVRKGDKIGMGYNTWFKFTSGVCWYISTTQQSLYCCLVCLSEAQ